MAPSSVEDVLPLSPLQEGMLFHSRLDDEDAYVVQSSLDLHGPLDAAALEKSLATVVARHQGMRVCFRERSSTGEPVQVVRRAAEVPWTRADLSGLDAAARGSAWEELAASARTRFDLTRPPLLRALLIRYDECHHRLVLTYHHLIADGWSFGIVLRETMAVYRGRHGSPTLPPAPPLRDHVSWLSRQDHTAALSAWAEYLSGISEPSLVAGPQRVEWTWPRTVDSSLGAELSGRLTRLARNHEVTLSNLLHGAWALLLSHLCRRSDVVFGSTVSGRPPEVPGCQGMVGLFINTVPVRVRMEPQDSLIEVCRRLQQGQVALMPHHFAGLADIKRASGHQDLIDSTVVFQNYNESPLGVHAGGPELRISTGPERMVSSFPLHLVAEPSGDQILLQLIHSPKVFDQQTAESLVQHLIRILGQLADAPGTTVAELRLASGAELEAGSGGGVRADLANPERTLPELFEPAAGAVVPASAEGTRLSERERIMCRLFAEVLDTPVERADDDFFVLGGHSLLASRLISRVRTELGVEMSLREFYGWATPAGVVAGIDSGAHPSTGRARPTLRRRVV